MTERIWSGRPLGWDDGSELEAEIMRADHAFGAELRMTTAEEAVAGQRLSDALARELNRRFGCIRPLVWFRCA